MSESKTSEGRRIEPLMTKSRKFPLTPGLELYSWSCGGGAGSGGVQRPLSLLPVQNVPNSGEINLR
jgi:hypothetical protein